MARAGAKSVPSSDATAVDAVGSHAPDPPLMDVWSRSGPKYRIRASVLLALNVLLFAGVGSFAFWLRSGEWFAVTMPGYTDQITQALRFLGDNNLTLGALLLHPISVQQVPMQIVILGLLMATLISIPILVAILYRFWSSVPFIVVMWAIAVMPWLALTLLGSCVLASVKPFRTRFRFMSALVGLVPCVVYLLLAWRGSSEMIVGRIDPIDRIKFIAPWVLAIVAAGVVFAIVLTIARIVNYRPGAITPLLAIMFGLPVALFENHVGRDELYYRLLEARNESYFADVDASDAWLESARRSWGRHPLPRPPWDSTRQLAEESWLFELANDLGPHETALTRHQMDLVRRCDWFHQSFPDSRYTPNALYIKARAQCMRIDLAEFRRTKWIRFYDDFPNAASRNTWRIIFENRPDSVLGGVAALRLAQLDAREGSVERAIAGLAAIFQRFDRYPPPTVPPTQSAYAPSLVAALSRGEPENSLRIPIDRIVLEAHRLHDLLVNNRDPIYGYDPISGPAGRTKELTFGWADLDERNDRYADRLRELLTKYPRCQMEDNIEAALAMTAKTRPEQIEQLEACLDRFPDRDSAPEALFRLGVAYEAVNRVPDAGEAFAQLAERFPRSIWTFVATRRSMRPLGPQLTRAVP